MPLCLSDTTSSTPFRPRPLRSSKNDSHSISDSESYIFAEVISRLPSSSIPTCTYNALFSYFYQSYTLKYVASMYMNFMDRSILLSKNDFTFESSSDASSDTYDADTFSIPSASTTIFTFLVDTPFTYDSSMTESIAL